MSSPTLRDTLAEAVGAYTSGDESWGLPDESDTECWDFADGLRALFAAWLTAPEQVETLARARYAAGSPVRDKDDNALAWDDLGPLLRKHLIADTALTLDVLARLVGEASES